MSNYIEQLRAMGYEVRPALKNAAAFRWWKTTDSDGVSVPPLDCSIETFATEAEAWHAVACAEGLVSSKQVHGNVSNYTAGQNHEPLEHEMAEYVELEVTLRSKTTFGTDKETIRVWDGQSAKDVAERTAQGYGAEVVEIRNPDGSIYEEALKVEDSPSPGM